MPRKLCIGIIGLGTVGTGLIKILQSPHLRNPLVLDIEIVKVGVKDIKKSREVFFEEDILTTDIKEIINDKRIDVIVELMGGVDLAKDYILESIRSKKSVVTANKAVIARYGQEIFKEANKYGVYVLIEAAVGGGIPIIEPLKKSLGSNKIQKISSIINGTTNYILSKMSKNNAKYEEVLRSAQELGYAEIDPSADVEGHDSADKISILSNLAYGGTINRENIPTDGINNIQQKDIEYSKRFGYSIKLLAISERCGSGFENNKSTEFISTWVGPTLVPKEHPLANVEDVNNAILVEGDPVGEIMLFGPGAGAGATASAVLADILNVFSTIDNKKLDPLLSIKSWQNCQIVDASEIIKKNYLRLICDDSPGVIGKIGKVFGDNNVSIESIIQLEANDNQAEIIVITHQVKNGLITKSLNEIEKINEVKIIASKLSCL